MREMNCEARGIEAGRSVVIQRASLGATNIAVSGLKKPVCGGWFQHLLSAPPPFSTVELGA